MKKILSPIILLWFIAILPSSAQKTTDENSRKISLYDDEYELEDYCDQQTKSSTQLFKSAGNSMAIGGIIFALGSGVKIIFESGPILAKDLDEMKSVLNTRKNVNIVCGVVQVLGTVVTIYGAGVLIKAAKVLDCEKRKNKQSYFKPSDNGIGVAYVF